MLFENTKNHATLKQDRSGLNNVSKQKRELSASVMSLYSNLGEGLAQGLGKLLRSACN